MKALLLCLFLIVSFQLQSQVKDAPLVVEGDGPFSQLILRGVNLIDGTGAPMRGPIDIVIEENIIVGIHNVGYPGVAIDHERRPKLKAGGKEMDFKGSFALPGFIDMHGHIGGKTQAPISEYVFKLWMAHGITSVRDPSCGNGLDWVLKHKKPSAQNKITVPR